MYVEAYTARGRMSTQAPDMELEALLRSAREAGHIPQGTTNEVNSKALLALNLRKLGDEHLCWAPRSYVVLRPAGGAVVAAGSSRQDEVNAFLGDFKASRAIAILQRVVAMHDTCSNERPTCQLSGALVAVEPEPEAEPEPAAAPEPEPEPQPGGSDARRHDDTQRPEGLWDREAPEITWEPRAESPITGSCVDAALSAVGAWAERLSNPVDQNLAFSISDPDWVQLRSCQLDSPVADDVAAAQCAAARAVVARLPAKAQPHLLRDNVWLLKPSLNGGAHSVKKTFGACSGSKQCYPLHFKLPPHQY
jgi:hypothetical protein